MRAFIIRRFEVKNNLDFEAVERDLIVADISIHKASVYYELE